MAGTRTHVESAAWAGPRLISRRAEARGAAWTAPLVVVPLAAPAFAWSGGGLRAAWTEVRHSGSEGRWAFCLSFANDGTEDIEVTWIKVRTRPPAPAHDPADDPAQVPLVVHTFSTPVPVTPAHPSGRPLRYCTPMRALEAFPDLADGQVDRRRLVEAHTSLLVRYTRAGTPSTLLLPMTDLVACRVTTGCR